MGGGGGGIGSQARPRPRQGKVGVRWGYVFPGIRMEVGSRSRGLGQLLLGCAEIGLKSADGAVFFEICTYFLLYLPLVIDCLRTRENMRICTYVHVHIDYSIDIDSLLKVLVVLASTLYIYCAMTVENYLELSCLCRRQ